MDIPANALVLADVERLFEAFDLDVSIYLPDAHVTRRSWLPATALFEHQSRAAAHALSHRGMLLADSMGLGKTRAAITAAESWLRDTETGSCLILAPLFTRATWLGELLALGAISSPAEFCSVESLNFNSPSFRAEARYKFCHYGLVSAWGSRFWMTASTRRPQVAILDEAHYVKNSRVKRSEASRVVAQQCPMRILLTGTPIENRVGELWHLLTILNGAHSWGSPIAFRRRYAGAYRGQHGWVDSDMPTNVAEFQARLEAAGYLRRTVDDVGLDLPPFTRQTLTVTLKRTDAHAHNDLTRGRDLEVLVDAVLEHRAGEDTIALLTALRKLTSRAKLAATIEYVSNLLDQGEDVVVFVWEREVAGHIQAALQDLTDKVVYRVTGEVTPAMRDTTVEHFQAHGGALVATIDALKEGVTLHRARFVVMHDLDWRPTAILQAEKRIHRIGQRRACQSVWVLGVSTIDVVLARCIVAKVKQASAALNIVDGQKAVEELGLEDAVGLESFETKFSRLVEEWRAQ